MRNTYCFSVAALVARSRLGVALYVHCSLSCICLRFVLKRCLHLSLCSAHRCHYFFCSATAQLVRRPPHCWGSLDHTRTPCRNPLNEWSAFRRGRYIHNATRKTNIHAGFEPVIPSTTQFQTYALDRTATGIYVVMAREDELERNVEAFVA